MPNETESTGSPDDQEAVPVKPDDEQKGPPAPAVPLEVTAAIQAFEDAVRLWWKDQDDATKAGAAGTALTAMLVAKGQPYIESIPLSVRSHFTRLQQQHAAVVRQAAAAALALLIPATVQAVPLSHLPTVTRGDASGDQDGGD